MKISPRCLNAQHVGPWQSTYLPRGEWGGLYHFYSDLSFSLRMAGTAQGLHEHVESGGGIRPTHWLGISSSESQILSSQRWKKTREPYTSLYKNIFPILEKWNIFGLNKTNSPNA